MSTREFLTKYKFKSTEIEYIIDDFERGSSHNRYNTTKQLLVNKKHIIKARSTTEARVFVDDLTTRYKVSRSTFSGWKLSYKEITENDLQQHITRLQDCALPKLERRLAQHL